MLRTSFLLLIVLAASSASARAQSDLGGCRVWQRTSLRIESVDQNHYTLDGKVAIDCDEMQFFADHMEVFRDTDRVTAQGHVLFVSGENRITADRMEFNTRTRTGTFFVASGTASLGDRGIDRSLFGTQEPDAYFWGETIEKLGPKTYRISRGGFTTCVQPTPRWEIVSGSVTMTLEDHALLKNAVLKVKGVPLMYLPVLYYPIQEDDRATGFLIPTYGASTVHGQSLSNAFFWAINRSQDATFYHDWFSKTGQGAGGEYRYVLGPDSEGQAKFYELSEHATEYVQPDGSVEPYAGGQSYQINGTISQALPGTFRLNGSVDYFSSIVAQQRYQQNVFAATNRTTHIGANVVGNLAGYTVSGNVERNEVFYGDNDSNVVGSLPRLTVSRPEQPIGRLPLYFSTTGEYVTLLREDKAADRVRDRGLTRLDILPTLRFPFTRWPYLTFNSSLSWRGTYWTESLDDEGTRVPDGIIRQYFDLSTRITGPVFNRIWSGPARKFKHVIEPTVTLQRITPIDNFDRIVRLESADYVVGSVTRVNYALSNRLYAKKDTAREIITVTVSQSYYTDANAAKYDRQYQSSFNDVNPEDPSTVFPPTHFSPIALQAHVTPRSGIDATFRTEYDTQANALRTLAANGTFSARGGWLRTEAGWSQRRFIPHLSGFNNPNRADHYINASTTLKTRRNTIGGTYSFNYDLRRDLFLQQRFLAYYNSQCCGVGVEYQSFNYGTAAIVGVPQDHRFNISFTLAGIGSFSNLFGAFGGQQAGR